MANDSSSRLWLPGVFSMLRRRKFYLAIPIVVLTAGSAFVVSKMPERFRAQTLIASVQPRPASYLNDRPEAAAINVQEEMRTIRETLLADPILDTVSREFNLNPAGNGASASQAADDLRSKVRIQIEGPDAFYVGFEGAKRNQVSQVANRLAELFVENTSDNHEQKAEAADRFLDQEVGRLRQQLDSQEAGLKAYKQSVAQQLPDRLQTNLKLLENLRLEIQGTTDHINESQARRSAVTDELKELEKQGALVPRPVEKTSEQIALDEARSKLDELKTRYTPAHPAIAEQEKVVRELAAKLGGATPVHRDPSPLQLRYASLKAELKSLDERLQSYARERDKLTDELSREEKTTNSSPSYETSLDQRTKDAALARSQYEALFAKQQEAKLHRRAEQTYGGAAFKIVEPARVPEAPYSPHRARIILLGLLAGVAVGIGAMLFREHLDTSFVTVEDLQGYLNLPVLSAVPTINRRPMRKHRRGRAKSVDLALVKPSRPGAMLSDAKDFQKHRIAVVGDPDSIPAEQYRILTLKVTHWVAQTGGQVLAVTSAAGGEGKSVTALNLSFALASLMPGRVLLVDGDARRPRVHAYLGIDSSLGLSNLLRDRPADLGPYITRIGSLDVIPGGTLPFDPATVVDFERAEDILTKLRSEYRVIVLDSPPIVPTVDSHILAGMADAVMVVVRARQTKRELLKQSIQSLDQGSLMGTVLNDVDYRDSSYACAYHYYQKQYLGTS